MTTPDIAGLCERLRGDLPFHEDDGAVNECAVYARLTQAADTLERQAAEIERLREAAECAADTMRAESLCLDGNKRTQTTSDVLMKQALALEAALTGEDAPQPPNNERTG
jgi:hypothetical protein